MTLAEYSLVAFAVLNGGRAVAYIPQMIRVHRDPNGAAAVSILTWALFMAANVATVCYALVVFNDRIMAAVFAFNAAGCLAIVVLTATKRVRMSPRRVSAPPPLVASLRASEQMIGTFAAKTADSAPTRHAPSVSARYRDEMLRQGLLG